MQQAMLPPGIRAAQEAAQEFEKQQARRAQEKVRSMYATYHLPHPTSPLLRAHT